MREQSCNNGGSVSPGAGASFTPNVVPFINGASVWAEDSAFSYQNSNLGIGVASPSARVHIKGNSDIVGDVFKVESLTNTRFKVASNGEVTAGGKFLIGGNITSLEHVIAGGGGNILRIGRGTVSAATGITFSQSTGGSGIFNIAHTDTVNSSGNANIGITPGSGAFIILGASNNSNRTNIYGNGYGLISNYALSVGHQADRGINFSSTNISTLANIIQSVHSGAGKPLSLNYYGGNVSVGAIGEPTALLDLEGSTTARASLRIRTGVAPSAPNDGDMWSDGSNLFIRLSGVTRTIQMS